MQYSKNTIAKALFLAPLPLLFCMALFFIVVNREYSLYAISVVFFGHLLVYLVYCILIVPFTFLLSLLLNRYHALNLLTICISAFVFATPFFMLLGWAHTGTVSSEWWKMYRDIITILMVLLPSACYWLFLMKFNTNNNTTAN